MRCVRGVLKTPKHEFFCPRYCPQAPRMAAHMVPNFLVNIILIHSTIYLEGCLSICCCLIFICCCLSVYLLLSDIYLLTELQTNTKDIAGQSASWLHAWEAQEGTCMSNRENHTTALGLGQLSVLVFVHDFCCCIFVFFLFCIFAAELTSLAKGSPNTRTRT